METTNHECYVSLEVAKLLKEAGFDWECNRHYTEGRNILFEKAEKGHVIITRNQSEYPSLYFAPTLEVAQRWLREVKNITVYVCPTYEPVKFVAPNVVADDEKWVMKWQVAALHYDIESDEIDLGDVGDEIFDTYEKALESGEKKVLEIILEKGE